MLDYFAYEHVAFQPLPTHVGSNVVCLAAEFVSFSEPGFTKIVWAIAAQPVTPDASLLSLETRVLATDAA